MRLCNNNKMRLCNNYFLVHVYVIELRNDVMKSDVKQFRVMGLQLLFQ